MLLVVAPDTSGGRRLRVIVADDEPEVRRVIVRLLRLARPAGAELDVVEAASAEEALGKLEQGAATLLVTDFRMSGRTGGELLEEVRERWPATRRVLVTGHADILEAGGMQVAAEAVVRKPWDTPQFVAQLRGMLL